MAKRRSPGSWSGADAQGVHEATEARAEAQPVRSPIQFVPSSAASARSPIADSELFPQALSPVAGLVAASTAASARITDAVGKVNAPRSADFALDDNQRMVLGALSA